MTTEPMKVSDTAGLLATVPMLMGFQPEMSVVAVCLERGRVVLSMRVDLGLSAGDIAEAAVMAARRTIVDELVLIGYVPTLDSRVVGHLRDIALAVETRTLSSSFHVSVRHMLAVSKAGWVEVPDWGEDALEIRELSEIDEHPIVAERVLRGFKVEGSRDDVRRRVQPNSEEPSVTFEVSLEAMTLRLSELSEDEAKRFMHKQLDAVEDCELDTDVVDDVVLARMTGLLAHPDARDAAMLRIDVTNAKRYVEVWSRVVRLTTGRPALQALWLTGTAAWLSGDGALMNLCSEEGHKIDPEHIGVKVLSLVTAQALPPSLFDTLKSEMKEAP